ncbi:hypothetical protein [Gynuella sunshinyii]|uniref:Uncharacterized protein n=1 Tax=Gynuella sunshinyii YC6258 TaxID=1445510 RepID=A0A0C5VUW8_9GAMM|nr:hypothetical protein [Gynuella sunshinyii]AJQ97931.1 hypothetical Protein YC6258_05905 [Gynuella sunshinyii YC6258]
MTDSILIRPNKRTKAKLTKLAFNRDTYLKEKIFLDDSPPRPIGEVNQSRIGVLTYIGNIRTLFLLPWLLGLCLTLYWQIDDLYEGWKNAEKLHIDYIKHRKETYGSDYFEKLAERYPDLTPNDDIYNNLGDELNKYALSKYYRIENGRMPLKTYFHYHYYETAAAERFRKGDTILAIFYAISIPALIIALLRFRRRAPIYFDREKQLVYTWQKGTVWAQYFDELIFYSSKHGMGIALYSYDHDKGLAFNSFAVTPSGNAYLNSENAYHTLMAYVTRFMLNGRESVSRSNWRGRQGWYLREDKKPKDFDEQLQSVLMFIKDKHVNEQAESLAKEWGYL